MAVVLVVVVGSRIGSAKIATTTTRIRELWHKCYTAEEIGAAVGLEETASRKEVSALSEDLLKERKVTFSDDFQPKGTMPLPADPDATTANVARLLAMPQAGRTHPRWQGVSCQPILHAVVASLVVRVSGELFAFPKKKLTPDL
jgi:hypothetical protein